MKTIVRIGVLALGLGALAAPAWADNLGGLIGNTTVCTAPDGGVTKVKVMAGGAYTVQPPGGALVHGTVKDDGSQICYTETDPAPAAGTAPVCTPSGPRKPGDTWIVQAQGATQNCVLKAGDQ